MGAGHDVWAVPLEAAKGAVEAGAGRTPAVKRVSTPGHQLRTLLAERTQARGTTDFLVGWKVPTAAVAQKRHAVTPPRACLQGSPGIGRHRDTGSGLAPALSGRACAAALILVGIRDADSTATGLASRAGGATRASYRLAASRGTALRGGAGDAHAVPADRGRIGAGAIRRARLRARLRAGVFTASLAPARLGIFRRSETEGGTERGQRGQETEQAPAGAGDGKGSGKHVETIEIHDESPSGTDITALCAPHTVANATSVYLHGRVNEGRDYDGDTRGEMPSVAWCPMPEEAGRTLPMVPPRAQPGATLWKRGGGAGA